MEFDNDRSIRPTYKIEIFYWILVFLFYPLINFFTFFSTQPIFLPILLVINILLFPFYFLYAKVIIPEFLFTKRYVWFGVISFALYVAIHLLLMLIYSFFNPDGNPNPFFQYFQSYGTYSSTTFMRESLWIL